MLRLGVWKKQQFFSKDPESPMSRLYYRLSRSRVSMQLLAIPADPSSDDIDTFERLMPHVRLTSGVYRTTYRRRFRDLDPLVNELLNRELAGVNEPVIEDWAASACLTSIEWFETLVPIFPGLSFTASDLVFFLVGVDRPDKGDAFVVEEDGRPLQYVKPPLVIRMDPAESFALPINRFCGDRANREWRKLRASWKLPEQWLDPGLDQPVQWNGCQLQKLHLVHPLARRLTHEDARFSLRRHSIFESLGRPVHVIRSMNILNLAYFSREQLLVGVRCAIQSLLPGGVWILGRTIAEETTPVHEATIFRKEDSGKLTVVQRIGPGSEIESLALAAG